jgi:dipeptidyl aminopeptidase/acylaminoacyl peptidase
MTTVSSHQRLFTGTGWVESFAVLDDGRAAVSWSTAGGPRIFLAAPGHDRLDAVNDLESIDQASPVACGSRVAFWARLPAEDNRVALFATGPGCAAPVRLPVADGLRPRGTAWCGPDHLVTTEPVRGGAALIRVEARGAGRAEQLWTLPGGDRWCDPVPVAGPGRRLVLTVHSEEGRDLVMFDPDTRVAVPLLKGNRSASPAGVRWSPDGERLVVLVRRRRETEARLIDLTTGTMESLAWPGLAGGPAWSPDGGRLVAAVSRWPWTILGWHEPATGRTGEVPIPEGTCAEAPQWHGGGCYFTLFGPSQPPALYRWNPGSRPEPVTPPQPKVPPVTPTVVRLATPEGFDLPAIVHEPPGQARGTVLMLHGGPAAAWRISWNPLLLALLAAGYRVVLAETRGGTFSAWPIPPLPVTAHGVAECRDVGYCIDELIRRGLARAGQIALHGHSHGGFVAYRTAQARPEIAGVIMSSGYLHPAALASSQDPEVHRFAAAAYGEAGTFGAPGSPFASRCPVLMVHGERDRQVPAAAAAESYRRLDGAGHRWVLLPGEEHGFRIRRNAARFADEAVGFLDSTIGGRRTSEISL